MLIEDVSIVPDLSLGVDPSDKSAIQANVQDGTYSGSERVNMWDCCLPYPVQNSVGFLTDFLANRVLGETTISYDRVRGVHWDLIESSYAYHG